MKKTFDQFTQYTDDLGVVWAVGYKEINGVKQEVRFRIPTDYVSPVTGKSLISDSEITRLINVTNQTLEGLGGETSGTAAGLITTLKDGVSTAGNTLKKLFDLIGGKLSATAKITTENVESAVDNTHAQNTDIKLDEGGSNEVTAAQAKIGYTHSQTPHAPSNAEQNVNADWNATGGAAEILNKPEIPVGLWEPTLEYGRLYNWFAVDDERNIAPTGWHIATSAEWDTLIIYLGGDNVAGGKLKEVGTLNWYAPNAGATNEVNFFAFPSGWRNPDGVFSDLGKYGYYWTTDDNAAAAPIKRINYDTNRINYSNENKLSGFAVRCIRDENNTETNVTDIDGNYYNSVTIGDQTWLVQNLATTKYRNGDPISEDFNINITGACANYGGVNHLQTIYGEKIYQKSVEGLDKIVEDVATKVTKKPFLGLSYMPQMSLRFTDGEFISPGLPMPQTVDEWNAFFETDQIDHVIWADDGLSVDIMGYAKFEIPPEKFKDNLNIRGFWDKGLVWIVQWSAFRGCTNLMSLSFDKELEFLGNGAFEGCTGLTDINIPSNIELHVSVFSGCSNLTSANILTKRLIFGDPSLFEGCVNLLGIQAPITLKTSNNGGMNESLAYVIDNYGTLITWTKDINSDIQVELDAANAQIAALQVSLASKMNKLSRGNLIWNIDANTIQMLIRLGFDLSYANLNYVNLQYANLFMANFSYANLSYANLTNAYLSGADLSGANLSEADLSGADLSGADLSGANLFHANLMNVNLTGTKLVGANFTSAQIIDYNPNSALIGINIDPLSGASWTLTWVNGLTYSCNPTTGNFTQI